jgi:F0F1-type ATP synthase assembly protein I
VADDLIPPPSPAGRPTPDGGARSDLREAPVHEPSAEDLVLAVRPDDAPPPEAEREASDAVGESPYRSRFGLIMGALIGIGLGLGAAKFVDWKTPLPAAVAPWSLVAATMLGLVVGIVSGVYPARRAARLDPIEALRQE